MLKCKNCGADIPFNPATQTYICPYCGSEYTEEELTEEEKQGEIKAEEYVYHDEDDKMDVYIYTCPQCGGELMTTEETYATFCSYCGASVALQGTKQKEFKPKYIIPFKVTKEQAEQIYNNKMKGAIFAPSYVKKMNVEKVRGIYMPYWTYGLHMTGIATGEDEEIIPAPGGTIHKTYSISANVDLEGDGIEYDAASNFPDDLSQAAAPFHFDQSRSFQASYMSGFYADRGNVAKEEYEGEAEKTFMQIASKEIGKQLKVGSLKFQVDKQTGASQALYPVWFIFARNEGADKISYAVINGQTGKMAADIPTDPKKLIIGTFIIAIPIFLLTYLFMVPTPRLTDMIIFVLSIISLVFTISQMMKNGAKNYILSLIANIVSMVICMVLFIVNPFQDGIHYIGVSFATLFCMVAYVLLFKKQNDQMVRELPQLQKRGGE